MPSMLQLYVLLSWYLAYAAQKCEEATHAEVYTSEMGQPLLSPITQSVCAVLMITMAVLHSDWYSMIVASTVAVISKRSKRVMRCISMSMRACCKAKCEV